jgi:hypothetical protein
MTEDLYRALQAEFTTQKWAEFNERAALLRLDGIVTESCLSNLMPARGEPQDGAPHTTRLQAQTTEVMVAMAGLVVQIERMFGAWIAIEGHEHSKMKEQIEMQLVRVQSATEAYIREVVAFMKHVAELVVRPATRHYASTVARQLEQQFQRTAKRLEFAHRLMIEIQQWLTKEEYIYAGSHGAVGRAYRRYMDSDMLTALKVAVGYAVTWFADRGVQHIVRIGQAAANRNKIDPNMELLSAFCISVCQLLYIPTAFAENLFHYGSVLSDPLPRGSAFAACSSFVGFLGQFATPMMFAFDDHVMLPLVDFLWYTVTRHSIMTSNGWTYAALSISQPFMYALCIGIILLLIKFSPPVVAFLYKVLKGSASRIVHLFKRLQGSTLEQYARNVTLPMLQHLDAGGVHRALEYVSAQCVRTSRANNDESDGSSCAVNASGAITARGASCTISQSPPSSAHMQGEDDVYMSLASPVLEVQRRRAAAMQGQTQRRITPLEHVAAVKAHQHVTQPRSLASGRFVAMRKH